MDFRNAKELLALCSSEGKTISRIMIDREMYLGNVTEEYIVDRMKASLHIMRDSVHTPLSNPVKSMGGLIGGEGKKALEYDGAAKNLCGSTLTKAMAYALSVLEVNGSMGLIVAAPTAGSSGVVPGSLIAIAEDYKLNDNMLIDGLLNAGAIGYILTRNASVSGAEAGCQAEVGAASAMAASAIVELFGGSPEASLSAASMALSNLLGLVCDPIAGLVEAPCQSRNAIGVANAFSAAQLAMSGISHLVPFDEMAAAMYSVGKALPFELRETALGGNAATPTGCSLCGNCK